MPKSEISRPLGLALIITLWKRASLAFFQHRTLPRINEETKAVINRGSGEANFTYFRVQCTMIMPNDAANLSSRRRKATAFPDLPE